MMISLDGFFEGLNHELDWHRVDAEFSTFAAQQLDNADTLLFGRKTYELMAGYWTRDSAKKDDPEIAARMNAAAKIVFSRTRENAEWENTRVINDQVAEEVRALKNLPGRDLLMLGSNNLAVSFLEEGLLDEIRIMVNPIALGTGHALFTGIAQRFGFTLIESRSFASGNALLRYSK